MAHIEDPYAIIEDGDSDLFVKIAEHESSDDFMELPLEKDGTILLSTVTAQFPKCTGLKYKSASGNWRGIRAENNVLDPPDGGWGAYIYFITGPVKRKSATSDELVAKIKKRDPDDELRQDLIVKNVPLNATDEDLEDYFTKNCGEMELCEVKKLFDTKSSRGFGFIRFKSIDAAKLAINGTHIILDQKVDVQKSVRREMTMKLFVGRLPEGTTEDELKEHFEQYGELIDVFVPRNFRGFGFVTYACDDVGSSVLRKTHDLKGVRLNVTKASPKETTRNYDRNGRQDNKSYSQGYSTSKPETNDRKEKIVDILASLIAKR